MRPCPSCGAPLSPDARFCNHCGQTIAAAPAVGRAASGGGSMRVCPSCGVIAPQSKHDCTVCGRAFGAGAPTVEARFDKNYWACIIECDFACRGCGLRSPLDSLDTDGEVDCRRCGLTQTFDADQWDEALVFAQDVADCAGPPGRLGKPPVVPNNDYQSIGVSHTFAEKTLSGMVIDGEGMKPRSLRIKVAPGVPLCERCCVPLDVQVDTDEYKTQTVCPQCHERALYDTPEGAFDHNADISAVLADDHRCDREPVHLQPNAGGGAVAITCPRCNASLPVTEGTTLINCNFCGTPSRIPRRALGKLGGDAKPKRWWILFDDDSRLRLGVSSDDDDDSSDDDGDHDHDDYDDDRMARVRAAQAAEASARARPAEKPTNGPALIGGILGVVAVLAVGGVAFSIIHGRANAPPPAEEAASKAEKAKEKGKIASAKADEEPAEPTAIVRSKFQDLKGCTCKAGKDTRQLAMKTDASAVELNVGESDTPVAKFELSWLVDSGGKFFGLRSDEATAPPRNVSGRGLAVGVACAGDVFVVVSGKAATGWSIDDKKPLWDETLAADYALPVTPSQKGLSIQCASIPIANDLLRIPLAGGKTATLKVTTGKPAK